MKRIVVIAWIAVLIGFAIGYLVGSRGSASTSPEEVIAGGSHTGNAIELSLDKSDSSIKSPDENLRQPKIDSGERSNPAYLAVPAPAPHDSNSSQKN